MFFCKMYSVYFNCKPGLAESVILLRSWLIFFPLSMFPWQPLTSQQAIQLLAHQNDNLAVVKRKIHCIWINCTMCRSDSRIFHYQTFSFFVFLQSRRVKVHRRTSPVACWQRQTWELVQSLLIETITSTWNCLQYRVRIAGLCCKIGLSVCLCAYL